MPKYGNIFYTPGLVRLTWDDPSLGFLADKLIPGKGIDINLVPANFFQGGTQMVISAPGGPDQGMGEVVTVTSPGVQLEKKVSTALIDASAGPVQVILPDAAGVLDWITLICLDNSNPITIVPSMTSTIFTPPGATSNENLQFCSAGDAFIFASNRKDTWFAISRYSAMWYC